MKIPIHNSVWNDTLQIRLKFFYFIFLLFIRHRLIKTFCFLQERLLLTISNYVFTAIFVAEMTVKVGRRFSLLFCSFSTILSLLSHVVPLLYSFPFRSSSSSHLSSISSPCLLSSLHHSLPPAQITLCPLPENTPVLLTLLLKQFDSECFFF